MTERAPASPRRPPRFDLTGLEWKLLSVAGLAATWTLGWLVLAPSSAPSPAGPPGSVTPTSGALVNTDTEGAPGVVRGVDTAPSVALAPAPSRPRGTTVSASSATASRRVRLRTRSS